MAAARHHTDDNSHQCRRIRLHDIRFLRIGTHDIGSCTAARFVVLNFGRCVHQFERILTPQIHIVVFLFEWGASSYLLAWHHGNWLVLSETIWPSHNLIDFKCSSVCYLCFVFLVFSLSVLIYLHFQLQYARRIWRAIASATEPKYSTATHIARNTQSCGSIWLACSYCRPSCTQSAIWVCDVWHGKLAFCRFFRCKCHNWLHFICCIFTSIIIIIIISLFPFCCPCVMRHWFYAELLCLFSNYHKLICNIIIIIYNRLLLISISKYYYFDFGFSFPLFLSLPLSLYLSHFTFEISIMFIFNVDCMQFRTRKITQL